MSDIFDIEVIWSTRLFDTKSNHLYPRIILRLAVPKESRRALNLAVSVYVSQPYSSDGSTNLLKTSTFVPRDKCLERHTRLSDPTTPQATPKRRSISFKLEPSDVILEPR